MTILLAGSGLVSCDTSTTPPGIVIPDTIFVDHGRESLITVRGKVVLTRFCIERLTSSGIDVQIPEVGRSSTTDSAGNFVFENIPKRELTFTFKRAGFYDLTRAMEPVGTDSGYTLPKVRMGTLNNWSGRFEGDTTSRNGWIVFQIIALDDEDQPANGEPWLLISDKPGIDTRDTATYSIAIPWERRDWGLEGAYLGASHLDQMGILSGEEFYVTPTSIASCASGFGSRHGEVRKYIRPL